MVPKAGQLGAAAVVVAGGPSRGCGERLQRVESVRSWTPRVDIWLNQTRSGTEPHLEGQEAVPERSLSAAIFVPRMSRRSGRGYVHGAFGGRHPHDGRPAALQRLQTVTDSVRIFGKRHQADARLGGRQWLKCQLFDLQQTLVSQLLWLAPRTPASVPRDWLKSTLKRHPLPRSRRREAAVRTPSL